MGSQLISESLKHRRNNFDVMAVAEESSRAFRELQNYAPHVVVISAELQDGPFKGFSVLDRMRASDCVVGGFRYLEKKRLVGSLLLGLYNDRGLLDHVGYTSSIHDEDRVALTKKFETMIKPPGFTGKAPGGPSRWSTNHSVEWQPLRTKLVVEVQFDHFTGGCFRHGTKFLRWRPEKAPEDCTMKQVRRENRSALGLL